jgi:hypothetical protein
LYPYVVLDEVFHCGELEECGRVQVGILVKHVGTLVVVVVVVVCAKHVSRDISVHVL